MNLLKAVLYDPTTAVSKATSAALAMTALDTTNLRLAVTVPAHGMVRFFLFCTLEGATSFPQILLGVLNGATVVGRIAPLGAPDGTALATTRCTQWVEFTATGLTPGAANFDAAYGVETLVAATNIKYGGPNNTVADDAWGAFVFEAWDPQPQTTTAQFAVDANGRIDVGKWLGTAVTAATAGIPDTNVKNMNNVAGTPITTIKAVQGLTTADTIATLTTLPAIPANWLTAAGINAAALNGKGDWNIGKTGYALTSAEEDAIAAKINDAVYEGSLTLRQIIRVLLAALGGKADGLAGVTVHYRDQADAKNRITATVDANGNRTAVTVDGT